MMEQMEGSSLERYKLGIHPLIIDETKFKLNRNFLVTEETRKDEHGHTGRGSAVENCVADITINAIAAKPNESEAIRQAGSDLFLERLRSLIF